MKNLLKIALVACIGITVSCSSAVENKNTAGAGAASANNSNTEVAAQKTPEPAKKVDEVPAFKTGEDYKSVVRTKMLKDGWEPYHSEDAEKCGSGDSRCDEYPEMESCAGTGMGNCKFLWKKGEKLLAIFTVGDPYEYSGQEFEKLMPAKTPDLIGRYVYRSKHEYGTDTFEFDLKANQVATYKSEQEGGDGDDLKGAWRWDNSAKTVVATFVGRRVYVFSLDGKNLKLIEEPNGESGFKDTIYTRQGN